MENFSTTQPKKGYIVVIKERGWWHFSSPHCVRIDSWNGWGSYPDAAGESKIDTWLSEKYWILVLLNNSYIKRSRGCLTAKRRCMLRSHYVDRNKRTKGRCEGGGDGFSVLNNIIESLDFISLCQSWKSINLESFKGHQCQAKWVSNKSTKFPKLVLVEQQKNLLK